MKNLRFAVIGTGFWANYQIPAWMELEGVELVALYNRTLSKAAALAKNSMCLLYLGDKRPVYIIHADGSDVQLLETLHSQCAIDGSRAAWKPK